MKISCTMKHIAAWGGTETLVILLVDGRIRSDPTRHHSAMELLPSNDVLSGLTRYSTRWWNWSPVGTSAVELTAGEVSRRLALNGSVPGILEQPFRCCRQAALRVRVSRVRGWRERKQSSVWLCGGCFVMLYRPITSYVFGRPVTASIVCSIRFGVFFAGRVELATSAPSG